ncbi:MAG: hypothetical protein IKW53_06295, partial [Clostridia bacterium]|nr:hypothetical protein [Clostridia bacterium]
MTVFRKTFFVLCFVACVVSLIALSYFSVFSSYSGNDGEFPSLYGVLVTGNGGLVKAFSNCLFNSLPYT